MVGVIYSRYSPTTTDWVIKGFIKNGGPKFPSIIKSMSIDC